MHQSTKRQSNPIEIVSENPNRTNSDPTANKFRPEKNRPLRVNRQTKNGFDKTPTDGVGEGWCRRREGRTDHHKTEATSEEGKFGFWVVEVEESRWLCSREKSVVEFKFSATLTYILTINLDNPSNKVILTFLNNFLFVLIYVSKFTQPYYFLIVP